MAFRLRLSSVDWQNEGSATLFAAVSPPGSAFERLLGKYFEGVGDEKTLRLLGTARGVE